jgi:hypothetical protein
MLRSPQLLPVALAAAALVPALAVASPAAAAIKNPRADQAFKKGIRDVARLEGDGATPSNIQIACQPVPKVDDKGPCTGSFDLSKDGGTAHYVLTAKARTFRLSPGAIEYRVSSKATKKVDGLPAATDLLGFLQ